MLFLQAPNKPTEERSEGSILPLGGYMSKVGKFVAMPTKYSDFATFRDTKTGDQYTVLPEDLPKKPKQNINYAYEVEIWENNSGNAHTFKPED